MEAQILVGLMTAPDRAVAEEIVDQLVRERLIACGNLVGDVASIYRWQGAVERAAEILVIMKTTVAQAPQVIGRVRDLHPYDVPEVLFLPVIIGNETYVQWVRDNVRSAQDTDDVAKKKQS
jgi:periplasmic divalent cation tolerance protein